MSNVNRLKESKEKHSYESFDKMCHYLKLQIARNHAQREVVNGKLKPFMRLKPQHDELIELIMNHCELAVSGNYKNQLLFIEDPDSLNMISNVKFIERILANLEGLVEIQSMKVEIVITIPHIQQTAKDLQTSIKYKTSIRQLVEIPNRYLITKNNKVIDLQNDNQLIDINNIRLQYDILNNTNANFINESEYEEREIIKIQFYRKIISRIMQDWSGYDEEIEYLLWQIIYSVLQNDSHGKVFILQGKGGNGKSTFMELLALLSGEDYVVRTNIHQFGDPNAINQIDMQTRVIIGDDAATNYKIQELALSNMKTLSTHNPLSVNVKYENNKVIRTRAPFIQGTNTDVLFYENNNALKSRIILIPWTNHNFRESRDETFELDEMMQNQLFIDVLMMMCIEKVKYFKKFTIPDKVERATHAMIEHNDTIKQYLDDTLYKVDFHGKIPLKVLYEDYVNWLKKTNPRTTPLKLTNFYKAVEEKNEDFSFKVDLKDRARFSKHPFKNSISHIFGLNDQSSLKTPQPYIEFDNEFTDEELFEFENNAHPIQEMSNEDYQKLSILIHDKNKTYLQSIYDI